MKTIKKGFIGVLVALLLLYSCSVQKKGKSCNHYGLYCTLNNNYSIKLKRSNRFIIQARESKNTNDGKIYQGNYLKKGDTLVIKFDDPFKCECNVNQSDSLYFTFLRGNYPVPNIPLKISGPDEIIMNTFTDKSGSVTLKKFPLDSLFFNMASFTANDSFIGANSTPSVWFIKNTYPEKCNHFKITLNNNCDFFLVYYTKEVKWLIKNCDSIYYLGLDFNNEYYNNWFFKKH